MPLSASAPAVTQVLVENHRRFLSFLERRVPTREAAEDILQDAFIRGLTKAPPLVPTPTREGRASGAPETTPTRKVRASGAPASAESIVAWFYQVLRNAIVDHHRRAGAQARALDRLARQTASSVPPPDDAELFSTVCDCVRSLVTTLTPAYAEAIRRVDLDGAGLQVYAREQGITTNNAGVRLHRAHRALKKRAQQTCATCADHGCVQCSCLSARTSVGDGRSASSPADAGV